MLWLNIFENKALLLGAEILIIVVGSMILGILLCYLSWGNLRAKTTELEESLEEEKKKGEELRGQVSEINQLRSQLQQQVEGFSLQSEGKAKTIYDQQLYISSCEAELKKQKANVDQLNASIDSYQYRIQIIEEELEKAKAPVAKSKKTKSLPLVRANYEHVSQLLGRQVTENDLTLILGIGPKTSSLLGKHGIKTWEDLSEANDSHLREYLDQAGGIYKAHDPSQWAKQALMAARGEWRKLRVFQEKLRNTAS